MKTIDKIKVMSDVCFCNEGGICRQCYDIEDDEVKRLKVEVARLRDALEQIVNCEEGAKDMWEIAKEALGV